MVLPRDDNNVPLPSAGKCAPVLAPLVSISIPIPNTVACVRCLLSKPHRIAAVYRWRTNVGGQRTTVYVWPGLGRDDNCISGAVRPTQSYLSGQLLPGLCGRLTWRPGPRAFGLKQLPSVPEVMRPRDRKRASPVTDGYSLLHPDTHTPPPTPNALGSGAPRNKRTKVYKYKTLFLFSRTRMRFSRYTLNNFPSPINFQHGLVSESNTRLFSTWNRITYSYSNDFSIFNI